jgi:hypothetical protein
MRVVRTLSVVRDSITMQTGLVLAAPTFRMTAGASVVVVALTGVNPCRRDAIQKHMVWRVVVVPLLSFQDPRMLLTATMDAEALLESAVVLSLTVAAVLSLTVAASHL